MKRFILILAIIAFGVFMSNAVDATADKKEMPKFPSIFNFTFSTGGGLDVIDSKIAPAWYNAAWGDPNGAASGKTAIFESLKIPVRFYSVKLWGKDEVYAMGKSGDTGEYSYLSLPNLNNQVRNRFFAGLDEYFAIDKIMIYRHQL